MHTPLLMVIGWSDSHDPLIEVVTAAIAESIQAMRHVPTVQAMVAPAQPARSAARPMAEVLVGEAAALVALWSPIHATTITSPTVAVQRGIYRLTHGVFLPDRAGSDAFVGTAFGVWIWLGAFVTEPA